MDKIINVGLAGFGMSGQMFHAPFINADKRFCLKKVYERKNEKSKAEYPDIELVRSFDDLLTDDIDLVVISLPNREHVPAALRAMEAGKNVICEKPVAATETEARLLYDTAEKLGVFFTVYQNRRLDGDFQTVKKLIESGELGEIVEYVMRYDNYAIGPNHRPWRRVNEKGIDQLYDLGVHIIDQAYWLFGMPDEVYADMFTRRPESYGVDCFDVVLYYPGMKATLSSTQLAASPAARYVVNGRKGNFIKFGADVQDKAIGAGLRPPMPGWGEDSEENYGILTVYENGAPVSRRVRTEAGNYGRFYDGVYKKITAGEDFFVKPGEPADVIKIIEAAIRSNDEKRRIKLK